MGVLEGTSTAPILQIFTSTDKPTPVQVMPTASVVMSATLSPAPSRQSLMVTTAVPLTIPEQSASFMDSN